MKSNKYFMIGAAALCAGLLAGCQSEVMGTREYIPAEGDGGMAVEAAQFDPANPRQQTVPQGTPIQPVIQGQPVQPVFESFEPMETLHSEPIISPVKGRKSTGTTAAAGTYVVQSGDFPERIAKKHGISTAALMQANNLTQESAKKLQVGQKLVIPARSGSAVAVKGGKSTVKAGSTAGVNADGTYTVQAGDFPERIAKKLGVKVSDLMKANNLTQESATKLQIGQKLVVPGKSSSSAKVTPVVQPRKVEPKKVEDPVVVQPVEKDPLTEVLTETVVTEGPITETIVVDEIVSGELTTEILEADTTIDAVATKHKTSVAKIRELNPGMIPEDGKLTRGMILLVQPNTK